MKRKKMNSSVRTVGNGDVWMEMGTKRVKIRGGGRKES
jgi:hypothetical protein